MHRKKLLILEDDRQYLDRLQKSLNDDYDVITASDIDSAKNQVSQRLDIVLSDIQLGDDDKGGIKFLQWMKLTYPEIPVVMMTAFGSIEIAVEAIHLGAADFLQKPINLDNLNLVIQRIFERARLVKEVDVLKKELQKQTTIDMVGESQAIREVREKINIAAHDSHITVLIQGESGTGKELVARAIHREGKRKQQPFITESLKSREGDLIGSILFGHEKGSFTDADKQHKGLFEQADGGVLFLDEIAEMDQDTQGKLLRVIEEKIFFRMGGREEIEVDIQIITATNADLYRLVQQNKFREDLYYRLMVFPITIPPIRERKEDIPLIARYHLQKLHEQGRTSAKDISDEVLTMMTDQLWRGNVRELKNFIETAALYAGIENQESILLTHCSHFMNTHLPVKNKGVTIPSVGTDVERKLAELELDYIEEALQIMNGKKNEIYKLLGYTHRDYARRAIRRYNEKYSDLIQHYPLICKYFYSKEKAS